jgi:ABC-2 type transport system permease protein
MRHYLGRVKILLRSKGNLFWTFVFPLCLGLFFHMGFGNLTSRPTFASVDVFIASDKTDLELVANMKAAEYAPGEPLFIVNEEYNLEELETLLQEEKLTGYIFSEEGKINYRINENGLSQTITKSFLDEYLQATSFFLEIETLDPDKQAEILADMGKDNVFLQEISVSNNPVTNAFVIYFYALIAMSCMFGSYWGIGLIFDLEADNSPLATRVSVAPTSKMKLIILYFLAALTIHFAGNIVLITYLKFILGVEFSRSIFLIMLATLFGTIAGIAMGAMFSALIRGNYGKKEGIMTVLSLLLSALSGLMSVDVKYFVDKNIPFLSYLNPASLVTDSFYSLYYFSDLTRYFRSLGILAILSILMILATYLKIRRTRYDSV